MKREKKKTLWFAILALPTKSQTGYLLKYQIFANYIIGLCNRAEFRTILYRRPSHSFRTIRLLTFELGMLFMWVLNSCHARPFFWLAPAGHSYFTLAKSCQIKLLHREHMTRQRRKKGFGTHPTSPFGTPRALLHATFCLLLVYMTISIAHTCNYSVRAIIGRYVPEHFFFSCRSATIPLDWKECLYWLVLRNGTISDAMVFSIEMW